MKISGSWDSTQRRQKVWREEPKTQVSLSLSLSRSYFLSLSFLYFLSLPLIFYDFYLCIGYDDENGSYIKVLHDHIAYRYEIKEVIGKGSFAQVVKVAVSC